MSELELCGLSATELGAMIRGREISPVELLEAHLSRIEELNGDLIAFLHVCRDQAMEAARAAEAEIAAGLYRGPLHGLPIAYKDIYHVRGLPTTAGSKVMQGYVAEEDATVVARLRQAGAICLGKLNTTEFASGSMELFGEARNPWDLNLTTGGSSAGSGGALAARMIPLATGSDTGGSIRIPSSFCGVVGIKPTYGRVSRNGIVPLSWSLDHAGPMARTVDDVALLLQAMAGPDPRDPTAAAVPVPDYQAALRSGLEGVRLGLPRDFFFDDGDPEVISAVRAAVDVMRGLGAVVREVDLRHARFGPLASWAISYSEAFAFHRANFFSRPDEYTRSFFHKIVGAGCLTAEERLAAQRMRQVIAGEFAAVLGEVDAIVSPTTPYPAYPIGGMAKSLDRGRLTRPASLAGLPSLSVPCGFTRAGLPVGLQLTGRGWEEDTVLRIGHAYQQATDWHRRTPPIEPGAALPELSEPSGSPSGEIDAAWVLDFARLQKLSFITEANAGAIAAIFGPMKVQLAALREQVDGGIEPPVRPVQAR